MIRRSVSNSVLAAALDVPVAVGSQAGEGSAWGIALLARYCDERYRGLSLADYLQRTAFVTANEDVIEPSTSETEAYNDFLARYRASIGIEMESIRTLA
ncbi:MAG: hypothetical protein PUK40_02065 [Actinomycetaceae bacterium]|nr:hypothetical protein [Arcanobacterium sp.]MDD7504726.1 hypothetical protein [Actinomycetaceae bacterium]MDY6143099.1 hypothetical protein [Arcanobacterium sp.]